MKNKIAFHTITAALALAAVFTLSCGVSRELSEGLKFQNSAWNKMQDRGEDDQEVLYLYAQAIDNYKKCILNNKNLSDAYHNLGRIYLTGPKSLRNYYEASNYLYKAAEIYGKEKNWTFVSMCYNEIGTAQYRLGDYNSSLLYYKKSSELSSQFAGDEAQLYWLGLGVEQDLPKAMELYKKAALAGRDLWANIYALNYQIKEYSKGNYDNKGMALFMDYLHAKNMGEAKAVWMQILTQSADLGWPPAQVDMWVILRDDKEFSKGMPYLQKAIATGFIPAYFHMGYVYNMGLNNTQINYYEAQKWYEMAAVEGFPVAQSNLGALYFSNFITAKQGFSNQEMAYYWWNVSAEQGYSLAVYNRTLVASYRAPQSKFETTIQILNSVASIIDASARIYNSQNKSSIRRYVPPQPQYQYPPQQQQQPQYQYPPQQYQYPQQEQYPQPTVKQ